MRTRHKDAEQETRDTNTTNEEKPIYEFAFDGVHGHPVFVTYAENIYEAIKEYCRVFDLPASAGRGYMSNSHWKAKQVIINNLFDWEKLVINQMAYALDQKFMAELYRQKNKKDTE